jgi:sulfoxide reductase heme-binding subunit YedZ
MSVGTSTRRARRPTFRTERLGLLLVALVALLVVVVVEQATQGSSQDDTEARLRLATTAGGNVALFLLAVLVVLGFLLSHPTGETTFRLAQRLLPWHTHLWVFVAAFGLVHVASIVLDPFPKVSIVGALIPGLSTYRTWPIALGTTAVWAFLIMYLTARYASRLPDGTWLTIHRVAVVAFVLAWLHVQLIGSDSGGFEWLYAGTALAVAASAAYRLWASRRGRPSFAGWVRESATAPIGEAATVPLRER